MRITESTLRKIIREELDAVVSETGPAGNAPRRAYIGKNVVHNITGNIKKKGKISAKTGNTVYITYIDDDGKPAGTGRADLSAVKFLEEDATQPRFNALQNAQADILTALGQLRTSLSIAQRKGIPKLAAMVVDGDMTVKSAAKKLGASIRSIPEDAAKELSKN
jgi:hypothetical protein